MSTRSDQITGHAKSVAGLVTGNEELEAKGDKQTKAADAEARIDDVKDKVVDAIDHVTDAVEHVADKAKESITKK